MTGDETRTMMTRTTIIINGQPLPSYPVDIVLIITELGRGTIGAGITIQNFFNVWDLNPEALIDS